LGRWNAQGKPEGKPGKRLKLPGNNTNRLFFANFAPPRETCFFLSV
jgi:hypothetical protein